MLCQGAALRVLPAPIHALMSSARERSATTLLGVPLRGGCARCALEAVMSRAQQLAARAKRAGTLRRADGTCYAVFTAVAGAKRFHLFARPVEGSACALVGWDSKAVEEARSPSIVGELEEEGSFLLSNAVKSAPTQPGTYTISLPDGKRAYAGKATNLRDRLQHHAAEIVRMGCGDISKFRVTYALSTRAPGASWKAQLKKDEAARIARVKKQRGTANVTNVRAAELELEWHEADAAGLDR